MTVEWKISLVSLSTDIHNILDFSKVRKNPGKYRFQLKPLTGLRTFQVMLEATAFKSSVLILPLISESIEVVDNNVCELRFMLSCYRIFFSKSSLPIKIKEEYGSGIGSHVWVSTDQLLFYMIDYEPHI